MRVLKTVEISGLLGSVVSGMALDGVEIAFAGNDAARTITTQCDSVPRARDILERLRELARESFGIHK